MLKAHSVSNPLSHAWEHYKNEVKAARHKATSKNVHALRVATQRLEAIVKISRGLVTNRYGAKLIESLKMTRKQLGPLRDLQVESDAKSSKTKRFSTFVTKEKKKAMRKASRYLDNISLKKEKRLISKILSKKLISAEKDLPLKKMHELLEPTVQVTLTKFNEALAETTPKKMKNLHKFRVLAKQLRYQEEALKTIFGASRFNIPKLKAVQVSVGKIQDKNALLQNMDRYLNQKKHRKDEKLLRAKKKIEKIQQRRIQTEFKNLSNSQWAS